MADTRIDIILQQLDELPTLPAVAVKVLEVTGRADSSVGEVVSLISSDAALTTRVLQLVHQADAGVRGDITTVERAVVMLGFAAVRAAVLAISIFETFKPEPGRTHPGFNREQFWKHSIAVASCAELLARGLKKTPTLAAVDPGEAFVAGLLHDIGKVALDATLPKSFAKVIEAADLLRGNIADIERSVIGLDHMIVGKRLFEKWHLPMTLRECVWLHGQAPAALPASVRHPRMINLITLADLLVRQQHLGYSGNYTFTLPATDLIIALGTDEAHVSNVLQQLVKHIEPRACALGLGQATSTELYHQALTQANKELGRVSGQLASKNRKLQIRAKFFDALAGFQAELRPDAPPHAVLQAIAQTAVEAMDLTSAAAFSLPPGGSVAQFVLVDKEGQPTQSLTLQALTTHPVPPLGTGESPVRLAGPELEWLQSTVSPMLAHEGRFWITLEADGACIGGVVWGAAPGEQQRLTGQVQELIALSSGWSLALRTTQIREDANSLAEQLAETNRNLQAAQHQLLRSRTLVSLGEMAAGAAHEMNNPLAVISGRSQLLASMLADPKQKATATLIYEQSHRLSEIITELMEFARPQPPALCEVALSDLVNNALKDAKNQTQRTDTAVELTVTDVPNVTVDPKQVVAALTEVIANALQATEGNRGSLMIHGGFDSVSNQVVLTVSDDGCGMDEQTLRRAFDPFFSGKSAGRRRGLGLPKALRWLESSGGSMRLESRPGAGTRAMVLLPAVKPVVQDEFVQALRKAQ